RHRRDPGGARSAGDSPGGPLLQEGFRQRRRRPDTRGTGAASLVTFVRLHSRKMTDTFFRPIRHVMTLIRGALAGMRFDVRDPVAVIALCVMGAAAPLPATAQGLKAGNLLVANQEDASASLIDLKSDSMRFIPVGIGPHEAAISPSGRTGVVTVYGQRPPGNELAIIDIASGTVERTISLGQY